MIKVTLKQAQEFISLGYEIVCYVDLPKNKSVIETKRKIRSTVIPKDAIIGISIEKKGPIKGNYAKLWLKLKNNLWSEDITKTYTREEIEKELNKLGNNDQSFFAYLNNKMKCIRVIDNN